jgi:hypothetical protein
VGLTFGIGLKLAKGILKSGSGLFFAALSFICIGWLRLPMLQSIMALVALSMLYIAWRNKN